MEMRTATTMATTVHSTIPRNPLFHRRFPLPVHSLAISTSRPTHQFHGVSFLSPSFIAFCASRSKSLTTAYSLPDEATPTTRAPADPSFPVKKKAGDVGPDLKGASIFLLGPKSSMKTNVGKLLADALRYYYFDSDSLVEEAAGGEAAVKSLRESDEKGFRDAETEVLKQLSSMGRLVVCAGDGAVQSSTNLAHMRHGISIWIDVPLDFMAKQIIGEQSPLPASEIASGSHLEVLTELMAEFEENKGGYSTADATVSLQKVAAKLGYDGLHAVTAVDMALEVLKEIEKLTRVKKMMEEAGKPF